MLQKCNVYVIWYRENFSYDNLDRHIEICRPKSVQNVSKIEYYIHVLDVGKAKAANLDPS